MEPSPIIRKIKQTELFQLIDLYKHLISNDEPLPSNEMLLSHWNTIFHNPIIHYFVVEMDSKIVSSCYITIIPNLTHGARPYGLIENVVTHKDYRNRGLGTKLLEYVLNYAWQQNCYKVMLLTGSKKPETLRFYEQAGFRLGEKTGFIAHCPEKTLFSKSESA